MNEQLALFYHVRRDGVADLECDERIYLRWQEVAYVEEQIIRSINDNMIGASDA